MSSDGMKSKIEKLLAKAAGAATPEEAHAYQEKAQRLMIQWGIDEAELEAAGTVKAEEIVEVHIDYLGSYGPTHDIFAGEVCRGFGNLKVLHSSWGDSNRRVYIIGHQSDVQSVIMLLASLKDQAMSELKAWQRAAASERKYQSEWEKWKGNRQFLVSFAVEVASRLIAMRTEMESGLETGTALVLVGKQARVDSYLEEAYPNLRSSRGSMHGSNSGRAEGRAAGGRARLGGSEIDTQRELGNS